MLRRCPLCNAKLIEEHWLFCADYCCRQRDHFFAERVADGAVTVIKVYVRDSSRQRLGLKVYLRDGFSEVWRGSSRTARVKVPLIPRVDLASASEIRRVIQFWLGRGIRLRWSLISSA